MNHKTKRTIKHLFRPILKIIAFPSIVVMTTGLWILDDSNKSWKSYYDWWWED